ncbi:type I-E CRISPR-associated protein Cse1/CasA [Amaricoccus solimangrovi]|uniref:Type I-E CRISPR-associated protein Cse1/CasA n=1 Tax=Amaricoccus solimangrovi TaxID=2589815 RepID=A0A501WLE5_9RHOB|nr:type I-E CRISPR-associated protein Cse1/CasA [Amaricoccus solimangrovi]TPE47871.1 type I-E CRISPR-associated protein Cse1/CasA [Amaricoccus solimangrovi]
MPFNLIRDPWIPVATLSGPRTIRPDQITDSDVLFPAWPRADLNIACLELLIGLVALADPPATRENWLARRAPDPDRLRDRLAPYAEAFNLDGDGPRFLQDLEPLAGTPGAPDMLFIDSAGENAAKKNADLMVWRDRYPALDPALAAMALYTLQAHAPSGGAGNRTSMRGGGPLVTLVEPPDRSLWKLVWANVPCGTPQPLARLPWTRPTALSDKGREVHQPEGDGLAIEAFFGMPRRLRLVFENGEVTGVIQRPYGTNYGLWRHPLTPYYRMKPGDAPLPKHPRAGLFGYRNWLGVVAKTERDDLRERAGVLDEYEARVRESEARAARIIVAGWAMDNMKPLDFTLSVQPFVALPPESGLMLAGLVEAADQAALALRAALEPILAGGEARESEREAFHAATELPFRERFEELKAEAAPAEVAAHWLSDLRRHALARFDALALPGLHQREADVIQRIVAARHLLLAAFAGHGKYGGPMFTALRLERPVKKGKVA